MRKPLCIILQVVVLGCLLVGCSKKYNVNLAVRSYVLEESSEVIKPSVTLQENNKFSFFYSVLSSYLAFGSYEVDGDDLILKTGDGVYQYVFQIENETLIFNAEKSSELPSYADISDGAVFK